jgi:hypothetical protein
LNRHKWIKPAARGELPPDRRDGLIALARANQDADTLDSADAAQLGQLQAQRASDAAETAILNDRLMR